MSEKPHPAHPPCPSLPTQTESIPNLLERARQGDPTALPALRQMLREPAMVDRLGGNLPKRVRDGLLTAISDKDLFRKDAIAQAMTVIR